MLDKSPWSPSSEAHVIISQVSSLKDLFNRYDFIMRASRLSQQWLSFGWSQCGGSGMCWVTPNQVPLAPNPSQVSWPWLWLISENQLIHPVQISSIAPFPPPQDRGQIFWVSNGGSWPAWSIMSWILPNVSFLLWQIVTRDHIPSHARAMCRGRTEAEKQGLWFLGAALGGVKCLGNLKPMKLLERWTPNSRLETLLHFSPAAGSKSLS